MLFGISHIFPMQETPGIRFSPHSFWTLRSEISNFFAAPEQDIKHFQVASLPKSVSLIKHKDFFYAFFENV